MTRLAPGRYKLMVLSVLLCDCSTSWSQVPTAETSPSSTAATKPQEKHDLLQFVTIPAKALPEHVRLVERVRTSPLIKVTQNPALLDDPKQIKFVAVFFGMLAKQDLEPVRAGVVVIYQEKDPANEIGIYGLSFSDEMAANARFRKLTVDKKDPRFFQKGKVLLYVWKDDGVSNAAFKTIQDYFKDARFEPSPKDLPRKKSLNKPITL